MSRPSFDPADFPRIPGSTPTCHLPAAIHRARVAAAADRRRRESGAVDLACWTVKQALWVKAGRPMGDADGAA